MFNLRILGDLIEKDSKTNYKEITDTKALLNIFTVQALANFRPQISNTLLEVYLQNYNIAGGLYYENINIHHRKLIEVYKNELDNFITFSIAKKISKILIPVTNAFYKFDSVVYEDICLILKSTTDDDRILYANNAKRSLFANGILDYDPRGLSLGPKITTNRTALSLDEKIQLKHIILKLIDTQVVEDKFTFSSNYDGIISLLYLYAISNISASNLKARDVIKQSHDLFKFGNGNRLSGFTGLPDSEIFSKMNVLDYQYIDLTTSICINPKRKYNLSIDRKNVKNLVAFNLIRLELDNVSKINIPIYDNDFDESEFSSGVPIDSNY